MHSQRGFALLELTAAMLIATLLAVFAADRIAQRSRDAVSEAYAAWMTSVRHGAQRYIEQHASTLLKHGATAQIAGFADSQAPTLSELKAAGHLSNGFPQHGARGMSARIQLMYSSDCPSDSCRLDVLIYSSLPLGRDATNPYRLSMIAHWLSVAPALGGAVMPDRTNVVGGPTFSFSNPPAAGMAALPPGTVAMALTSEQLANIQYLRVGDVRDPDFKGGASIMGDVSASAALYVQEHLHIGGQSTAQMPCAPEGAIVRERYGGLLVCRSGAWRSAGGSGGGGFSLNDPGGCLPGAANPVTGNCSCPTGYLAVRIADGTSAVAAEGRTRGYICVG